MADSRLQTIIADAMAYAAIRYGNHGDPRLPDDFQTKIRDELVTIWTDATSGAADEVRQMFKNAGHADVLERKAFDDTLFGRIVLEFIERYAAIKITGIVNATADQIRSLISIGQREGLSVPETGKMIMEKIPDISAMRASLIARTELHGSSQFAAQRAADQSGFPMRKKWQSGSDSRTRDFGEGDAVVDEFSHRAMDGVTVPLSEPYMVPHKLGYKEPLMFPGDPSGSAGNVINCRCRSTFSLIEDEYGL